MHEYENNLRKPSNKHINAFASESEPIFEKLTNFNEKDDNKRSVNLEIVEFMHLLMDECTHLLNYDIPVDTNLIHVIAAKDDAYVLRDGVNDFNSIWPGSKVEYVDEGHVSAFIRSQPKFREAIINLLKVMINKHYSF